MLHADGTRGARGREVPVLDLSVTPVDPAAVLRLPVALCRRHAVLPIALAGGRLLVVMADPGDVVALDDVRALAGAEVQVAQALRADVLAAIDRHCRDDADLDLLTDQVAAQTSAAQAPGGRGAESLFEGDAASESPVVRFVDSMVARAVADRASDVHIDPGEDRTRVRYRIDGVLHDVLELSPSVHASLVSRLKVMADLDIADRRVPQDGRLTVMAGGREVGLRLATLPTVWGEKLVLRVLDESTVRLDLAQLAFGDANRRRYEAAYRRPYGMVLVTGPTGSGKSTTLYATLNAVSRPELNVITVEDPVEYRLPGLNQVQINPRTGMTFARALRSILRSDPDVVLLGEIRDAETATIAVEASLTGHLVLSTLHTNDAPSAVTRLVEMGVEPYLVGSALACVVAQRLARRLCDRCKEPYRAAGEEVWGSGLPWPHLPEGEPVVLHRPVGCAACARTGYRGRLALHEVMAVDEDVERLAVQRAPSGQIGALARERGMVPLLQDGLAKVLDGHTTVGEVLRVAV
ncbi:type IV pilus assembly protein PilB [Quadrisphaera granulorum]|uniref:Type IV pilus assembly protein PilB n=1 Tax=Quadrisphaera granulorum TaxID=317664 RepID=A0A315ZSS6_9ACTN|nr:GspE/PulE family protein [Quadrisphaera granulorum]PWJ47990.1 type IV pilus assembly protein PilB [Quadrisphaera granulorum]SZE98562.1 type IV pilus assembly protein PilB [Quadrisphaera granulorum]